MEKNCKNCKHAGSFNQDLWATCSERYYARVVPDMSCPRFCENLPMPPEGLLNWKPRWTHSGHVPCGESVAVLSFFNDCTRILVYYDFNKHKWISSATKCVVAEDFWWTYLP